MGYVGWRSAQWCRHRRREGPLPVAILNLEGRGLFHSAPLFVACAVYERYTRGSAYAALMAATPKSVKAAPKHDAVSSQKAASLEGSLSAACALASPLSISGASISAPPARSGLVAWLPTHTTASTWGILRRTTCKPCWLRRSASGLQEQGQK